MVSSGLARAGYKFVNIDGERMTDSSSSALSELHCSPMINRLLDGAA